MLKSGCFGRDKERHEVNMGNDPVANVLLEGVSVSEKYLLNRDMSSSPNDLIRISQLS